LTLCGFNSILTEVDKLSRVRIYVNIPPSHSPPPKATHERLRCHRLRDC
jgi:hypothetical protein